MQVEKKEAYPLHWPSDWPRTRLADQRVMASWKRSANDYREELAKELDRRKAPIAIISTNVPLSVRGQMIATAITIPKKRDSRRRYPPPHDRRAQS